MATRYIQTDFWTDTKVRKASSEERYFMLYLLTNQHTNQLGCYEIVLEDVANDMGFKDDVLKVKKLLKSMKEKFNFADFDSDTNEVFITNWYKYNWTKSPKVMEHIIKELEWVKSGKFKEIIATVCIPYKYPMIGYRYKNNNKNKYNYINIYDLIEKKFGRTISSIEYESIKNWEMTNIPPEIIALAINEAMTYDARSIKYIQKILYSWAKQGLDTEEKVTKYLENQKKTKSQKKKEEDDSEDISYEVL